MLVEGCESIPVKVWDRLNSPLPWQEQAVRESCRLQLLNMLFQKREGCFPWETRVEMPALWWRVTGRRVNAKKRPADLSSLGRRGAWTSPNQRSYYLTLVEDGPFPVKWRLWLRSDPSPPQSWPEGCSFWCQQRLLEHMWVMLWVAPSLAGRLEALIQLTRKPMCDMQSSWNANDGGVRAK